MWQLPYGEFDCEVNTILYLLREYDIPLEPLFRYNFDFYYDEEEDLLRGSVPLDPLLRFIGQTYGIAFRTADIDDIPLGAPSMLVVDGFYLNYANDYYNKQRLVHYFPAERVAADQFEASDPIFNYYGPLSAQFIRSSSKHLNRNTFLLDRSSSGPIRYSESEVLPYMAQHLDGGQYTQAIDRMHERFNEALDSVGSLYETFHFKKYFANLQNILKARLRHFESEASREIAGELHPVIIAMWRKATKAFMKIGMDRSNGIRETRDCLKEVSALEVQYVQKYKNSHEERTK